MNSMTAFARQELPFPQGVISWEIRAVNQRYLEANFKLAEPFRHLEMPLRDLLKKSVNRGKVEVFLKFHAQPNTVQQLDTAVIQTLSQTLEQLQNAFPNLAPTDPLSLLNWPGLVKNNAENLDLSASESDILQSFSSLLDTFNLARTNEGAALKHLMLEKLEAIASQIAVVYARLPDRLLKHTEKMQQRLLDLLGNTELDTQRLHQEIALLSQKLDIQEELDRLNTHIQAVRQAFESPEPVGRRLDFLMQEMNREANTLGSKALDSETTQASVELKVLIEQIREQVQNIE